MKRKSKKKREQTEDATAELSVASKPQKKLIVESGKSTEMPQGCEDSLPTREKDVALIERAIDRRIVPLIEGPVGCGKTALLRQIAFQHGKKETFCIIQMGEQVDSKGLFGSYHCTDIPGEFVWRPSVLANAIAGGHWVLLEDIDSAPAEVLGALMPLIELRRINLPGRGVVIAHDDFRLFVTVRTNRTGQRLGSGEKAVFLDKFWLRIRLQSFTDRELRRVISSGQPRLAVVSKRLVDTFALVVQTGAEFDRPTRLLSTRDLLKWCNRLASRCELDDAMGVFQEAIDVMTAFAPTAAMRKALMQSIASLLSISLEQVDYYATKHRPGVKISETVAVFGRVSLQRVIGDSQMFSNERFALTRPVCQLLERLAMCLHMNEAILLTGETGCGKTAAVQFIAKHAGRKLHVVNMSQQSESSDLLGGHKPVSMQTVMEPIRRSYVQLFEQSFSKDKNAKFLQHIQTSFVNGRWAELIQLMLHTARQASASKSPQADDWRRLIVRLRRYERVVAHPDALPFAFVQGVLLQAAIRGEWILLDEINLASAETLNCLCTLLDGDERIYLQNEGGEELRVSPDFRLIACMNPATDVGKRDLPVGVRNRFTEIFVDEVDCKEDLLVLAQSYLQGLTLSASILTNLVELYVALRLRSATLTSDAWGHHPNYSLRTFCRALSYASENPYGNEVRSLYEAFCMSFLTEVDDKSRSIVQGMVQSFILGKNAQTVKTILSQPVPPPPDRDSVKVEGYWIEKGDEEPSPEDTYVLTATVRKNMRDVARVLASRQHPVLLEGETSAGKTSLIRHMARLTGNTVVRINNHEHTDLQEYIGSYAAGADQRLVFVEGPLIEAMRKGYWVILDELNLAPPDVLEALNRLLDDNRELFITETNTTVRAHPRFVLLATQNPSGLYGGRKRLSRAFVNRFVQLRFGELPSEELQVILKTRCALPATYAQRMVAVMHDLQVYRSTAGVFAGKESYMTLRDLFRWGERYKKCTIKSSSGLFDWDQFLADQGYFLLGGRCRRSADEQVVKEVLLKHFKRPIDCERLFGRDSPYLPLSIATDVAGFEHIVWTHNSLRMAVLAGQSWLYDEPVLLVGETGCGKTSLCEVLSAAKDQSLLSINCHLMTEAADFLGRLRPATLDRQRETGALFEWTEGPLVSSMRRGCPILIDEISLAADSVLERLNSVLEPERQILLTETADRAETLTASNGFQLVATMNPGGDYGKKELSKALRNRFTEIWCSADYSKRDLLDIVKKNASGGGRLNEHLTLGDVIVDFAEWFGAKYSGITRCAFTIRDILAWTHFFNHTRRQLSVVEGRLAVVHGACVTLLDSLGATSLGALSAQSVRSACIAHLCSSLSIAVDDFAAELRVATVDSRFGIPPFTLDIGPLTPATPTSYSFQAPTCKQNLYRLLRAMSIRKPILMEGSPGAGKSSLVVALAKASGHRLVRLNLSDQTDLSDLFGSDLPTTNANGDQTFAWNDGPLLKAMKQGDWVLLDEMNLASQSVLEGLNACLDHRGAVFVPELGRTFYIGDSGTRFFACQNPFKQGGNRRGLPKSFINRFSVVYTEPMTADDELVILTEVYGERVAEEHLRHMVAFNKKLNGAIGSNQFADASAPWEFNLRDLLRWVELVAQSRSMHPGAAFDILYRSRMRTTMDREKISELYSEVFGARPPSDSPSLWLTPKTARMGSVVLSRRPLPPTVGGAQQLDARLLRANLRQLERLATCVHMNWLAIIVGHSAVGKSTLVRSLAALSGQSLNTFHLTSDTDALELLGSFEQIAGEADLNKAKAECAHIFSLFGEFTNLLDTLQSAESLQQLRAVMETAIESCSNSDAKQKVQAVIDTLGDSRLRFEWVNSPFLDAFIHGHWLLVENVNCCSAAVLDRLNSALEPNGELTLSEKGADASGQIASFTAHPNFRIFFTMNPRHGPISRAMRNRAVEICLLDEDTWTSSDQDVVDVTALMGVADTCSAKQLKTVFDTVILDGSSVLSPYSLLEGAFVTHDNQVSSAVLSPVFGRPIDHIPPKTSLEYYLATPSIVELVAEPSATQARWLSEAWALQCADQSSALTALLFAILSASAADVAKRASILLESIEQKFPDDLTTGLVSLVNSVSSALKEALPKSHRQMPFDNRFYGFVDLGQNSLDVVGHRQIADSVIHFCVQRIVAFLIALIPTEKESAAYFSDRFLKKRIGESSLPSAALKFLPDFTTAVRELVMSGEMRGDVSLTESMIVGMWDLLLFMRTANEKLPTQSTTAPVQLAWQMMQSSFLTGHGGSSQMRRAIGLISQEWSVDERAEMIFLEAYKRLAMVRPYTSADAIDTVVKVWNRVEGLNKSNSSESERQEFWQQLMSGTFADVSRMDASEPNECPVLPDRTTMTESALSVARQLTCALVSNKPVGEQLAHYLLRMQPTTPCSLVLAKTVDWTQFGDISLRLSWFNSRECVQSLETFVDRQLKNIHLLWLPVITEMVSVVWVPLHFEVSLSRLPLSAIGVFAQQIRQLGSVIWSAGTNLLDLSDSLRGELSTYARCLINEAVVGGSKDVLLSHLAKMEGDNNQLFTMLISLGLALLKQTTPPRRMLDPVVKARERRLLLERKLAMINDQIEIVNRYFVVTTGASLETHRDGRMKDHEHPLLRALWNERWAVEERLQDRSLDVIGVRPALISFDRLTTELASFSAMTDAALGDPIDDRPLKSRADASLQADAAKLYAWSKSAELILKTVTFEFSGYPDITMPYIMALNCTLVGVYGLAAALDAEMLCRTKRSELHAPSVTLLNPSATELSDEFVKWALHETSPLPNKLQMLVAVRALINGRDLNAVDWLKRTWATWHTNNVAKREKMFEYRSRAKNADGEPIDDDEIEMLAQFPDYSQSENDDDQRQSFFEPDPNLRSDDLCAVVDVVAGKSARSPSTYSVSVWLMNELRGADGLVDADSSHFADHMQKLLELATSTQQSSTTAVNVYADNDPARLMHCCELVRNLKKATVQLAEQWPEVGALKDIQSACDSLLSLSAASPMMRLAAKLESLLTECANWESVAHRGISLEPWLAPLRALLVDWRKMEVRCWEALIDAVDEETQHAALLASYPLIEACDQLMSAETTEINLTAVLIEWLQNSTIGDFAARLEAAELCACWVTARGADAGLAERLRSVRLYFAQFAAVVNEKLAALRSPLQKELKEFVKVVKYQDLNLWSVKLSAQKAHQQLFKIVKKYKQVVQEPIRPLVDQLLALPANLRQTESSQPVRFDSASDHSRLKRLSEISGELCETLNASAAAEALNELTDLVTSTGQELNTVTQYTGTDEEKEKQQGRAHAKRQKAVAKLLRATKACGITYRKGLKLDAEQQLQTLLTQTRFEHSRDAETIVRLSAALRTVVIGSLEKPNKQIGPQIAVSMRGIAQLVPDILIKTTARVDQLAPPANNMTALSSAISDAVVDANDSAADGRPSDQLVVRSSLDALCHLFARIEKNLADWSSLWQCAPTTQDGSMWNELTELLSTDNRLRIADIRRNEAEWLATTDKLKAALVVAQQLLTETNAVREKGTFAGDVFFWKRSILQTFADGTVGRVGTLLEDVDSLLQLCTDSSGTANPFNRPLLAARRDLLEAVGAENRLRESWSDCKRARVGVDDTVAQSAIERLLLTVQRLHKAFIDDDQVLTTEDVTVWLIKVVDGLAAAGVEQANDALRAFYQALINVPSFEGMTDDIEAVAEAARNVSRLVRSLVDTVKSTMCALVKAYHAMSGVFVKIAKDGYVDPIPKADDGGPDGKGKESFEDMQNAGMGEGQGVKDVTDEIEDLGQIEGLKGDNENESEQPPPEDPNSEQKPIEMEDDFSGNLEDIKFDQEEDENSDSGSDEENEPQPDWQMGDAEDNQEDQLDPNLWDKEEDKNDQPSNDDGTKGAQEKQDELGAKDDERTDEQQKGADTNLEAPEELDGDEDENENGENGEEEEGEGEEEEGMENIDLRDMQLNEDEESEGENATNTEEGMQEEGNEDSEDGENEERAEAAQDEENRPEEEKVDETDAKVDDDTAEATATAASETGLGHSEMTEQVASDSNRDQSAPNEQQPMDQQSHGDGDVEQDRTAETDADNSTVQRARETRDSRSSQQPRKRPNTEQREKKTLGDKSEQFERSNVERMDANEKNQSDDQGPAKSDRYAHEPNIDAEGEKQQVVDAATLEEAKESAVQMDQLDDVEEGDDDERKVADAKEEKDRDNADEQQPAAAMAQDEIKSAADVGEEIEIDDGGDRSTVGPAEVSDKSTIHTVLDFYEHASTALGDVQLDASMFSVSDDRNSGDMDVHRRHWHRLSGTTNALAAELTENLRLILEPTQASKLEGDYRTGKRLNMRRLIPYVASNFRKDKIWLRRTKKASREYQILIAVDDSSSMADNKTRELTLESVALLEAALRHLESGRLGVCKFGESTDLLHGFDDHFGDDGGAKVVSRLTFQQTKTDICQLLSFAVGYFGRQPTPTGSDLPAQLLVIVSDGRGLFADGMDKARRAVQVANGARIFLVFVVVDNPEHKDSIVDIKIPVFGATGVPQILSYMDFFPFPFYVILKRISALPAVIGDALRQWFEIVANRQ